MGVEIERKFLVCGDGWRERADAGTVIAQGYLNTEPARTVRVRRTGEAAWLTIKGESRGAERAEFEYAIPPADADQLLALCEPTIVRKTRHRLADGEHTWEIDVFEGDNAPLVLAEVELARADAAVHRPDWLGEEVTDDHRFQNASLSRHPYGAWPRRER